MEVSAASSKKIQEVAKNEQMLLQAHEVKLPDPTGIAGIEDDTSVKILNVYHPLMLINHIPLSVYGDGNCMYRAVSRCLFGTEEHHLHIRLLAAIEIGLNPEFYDVESRKYNDILNDPMLIHAKYQVLMKDTSTIGAWAEMLNIVAVSAALGITIHTYCPSTFNKVMLSDPLTKTICGRNVKKNLTESITLMWSKLQLPDDLQNFIPDHFVVLRKRDKPAALPVIDLDELSTINFAPTPKSNDDDSSDFCATSGEDNSATNSNSRKKQTKKIKYSPALDGGNTHDDSLPVIKMRKKKRRLKRRAIKTNASTYTSTPKSNDDDSSDFFATSGEDNSAAVSNSRKKQTKKIKYSPALDGGNNRKEKATKLRRKKLDFSDELPTLIPKKRRRKERSPNSTQTLDDTHLIDIDSSDFWLSDKNSIDVVQNSNKSPPVQANQLPGSAENGFRYLKIHELVSVLTNDANVLDEVPRGLKENCFFIVCNEKNISNRKKTGRSEFWDDCGSWKSRGSTTTREHFLKRTDNDQLQKLVLKDGKYFVKRQRKKQFVNIPLKNQSLSSDVLTVRRYYVKHTAGSYEKRVSWIECDDHHVACYEYKGNFPGPNRHGNSKQNNTRYTRLKPAVMDRIKEKCLVTNPIDIFDSEDLIDGPRNVKQVSSEDL